jgi:lysophospholipase L1-like esterase
MRIAFLGDSLTEGHPGESYLTRLRRLLPRDELRNGGRGGDTVPALLARLEHTGLEPADLALVWIGVNDAFLGDWYLPDLDDLFVLGAEPAGTHRLRPVYDRILNLVLSCAPLAVCVPPVLPDPFEQDGVAERVAELAAMMTDAAAARDGQARVFDLRPAFAAERRATEEFTIDGVHLSARGADVVAAAFCGLIAGLRDGRSQPGR